MWLFWQFAYFKGLTWSLRSMKDFFQTVILGWKNYFAMNWCQKTNKAFLGTWATTSIFTHQPRSCAHHSNSPRIVFSCKCRGCLTFKCKVPAAVVTQSEEQWSVHAWEQSILYFKQAFCHTCQRKWQSKNTIYCKLSCVAEGIWATGVTFWGRHVVDWKWLFRSIFNSFQLLCSESLGS